jgi:uncharacterized protein (DUF58 family)
VPVPTWRLAAAAAAGSLVVLLLPVGAPAGLWLVDGALLLAAAADWLLAGRPGGLEVERELPGIVPLGAEARVVWRVANRQGRRGPGNPGGRRGPGNPKGVPRTVGPRSIGRGWRGASTGRRT